MTLSSLDSVGSLAVILRIVTAVSILLLIHNLYLSATPASRFGLRMLSVGLGAAMVYDLNLYTIAFLNRAVSSNLFKIGRASCRERVCQYVSISVVAVSLKQKKKQRR